jgi:hypothetical protein
MLPNMRDVAAVIAADARENLAPLVICTAGVSLEFSLLIGASCCLF